jgi:hypothetical protein
MRKDDGPHYDYRHKGRRTLTAFEGRGENGPKRAHLPFLQG